jgi:hypothetical protein
MNIKKIKYKIFDNFLPRKEHEDFYNLIISSNFSWFMQPGHGSVLKESQLKAKKIYKNIYENFQLNHLFYADRNLGQGNNHINSPHFYLIKNFITKFLKKTKINKFELMRAKVNLQPRIPDAKEYNHNTPHLDYSNEDHNVLLYYINDSDGDTHFFKNEKIIKSISPKANRLVVFDGNILHTGSHPIKSDYRLILNINCRF